MQAAKLLFYLLISAAVTAMCAVMPVKVCFDGAESYIFFCGDTSADCREVHASGAFSLTKALLGGICGECAAYSAECFNLLNFLTLYNAEIVFTEELAGSVNYYCTADLPYSVELYGTKINLHVCVKEEGVLAASPIIFGGY